MMAEAFSYPFMYWVGMNTAPNTDAAALAEFNAFYSKTHSPEVVASNPGFVRGSRYELLQPDPRGDFGPRWLAVYEMDGEAAARTYAQRNDGPPEGRPTYTPGPAAWQQTQGMWRMIWRRITSCGTASQPPHSIYMVGMNVPPDTDAAGLAEFNAFYTNIHVPEVMAHRGYSSRHTIRTPPRVPPSAAGMPQVLRHLRGRRSHDSGQPTTPGQPPARSQPAVVGAAHLGEA